MNDIAELLKYIRPNIVASTVTLPTNTEDLYRILDSGQLSREEVGVVVRNRYPGTAEKWDRRFEQATGFEEKKKLLAYIRAFNYIRGMAAYRIDGSIDHEVAPRIMLSPSASLQVLDAAQVSEKDRVLELYSGVGYFSFFLAISKPERLDTVDLYAPNAYDLQKTFNTVYNWLYLDLPYDCRPSMTRPNFIIADCVALPDFQIDTRFGDYYDKIFLHPPYGKETHKSLGITEEEAFASWVDALRSVYRRNPGPFLTYSVVPGAWIKKLASGSKDDELDCVLSNVQTHPIKETKLFSLSLVITKAEAYNCK